jgi:hypothetical protein
MLAQRQAVSITGFVSIAWRAVRLKAVDLHFVGGVLVPTWLRPQRLMVAAVAVGFSAEKSVSPTGSSGIEVHPATRLKRR